MSVAKNGPVASGALTADLPSFFLAYLSCHFLSPSLAIPTRATKPHSSTVGHFFLEFFLFFCAVPSLPSRSLPYFLFHLKDFLYFSTGSCTFFSDDRRDGRGGGRRREKKTRMEASKRRGENMDPPSSVRGAPHQKLVRQFIPWSERKKNREKEGPRFLEPFQVIQLPLSLSLSLSIRSILRATAAFGMLCGVELCNYVRPNVFFFIFISECVCVCVCACGMGQRRGWQRRPRAKKEAKNEFLFPPTSKRNGKLGTHTKLGTPGEETRYASKKSSGLEKRQKWPPRW